MTYKSGLDPENDPVVYTTDYGLEIRYASAVTNSNLAGYTYFTMGNYNGTPVNWVIIGYDPSMHEYVQDVSGEAFRNNPIEGGDWSSQLDTIDNSVAGSAIMLDHFAISDKAKTNFEIGEGGVLCFSEACLGSSVFGSNNNYKGSTLQTYVDGLLAQLNFSDAILSRIVPQQLKTYYYYNNFSTIDEAKLFPLAGINEEENFDIRDYMIHPLGVSEAPLYVSYLIGTTTPLYWNTRSGHHQGSTTITSIGTNGSYGSDQGWVSCKNGVRPAFVLKI